MLTEIHDLIAQFDQRYRTVTAMAGREYIIELRAWLGWIHTDPRFDLVRRGLIDERDRFVDDLKRLAADSSAKLVALRSDIEARYPETKDTALDTVTTDRDVHRFHRFDEHMMHVGSIGMPIDWARDESGCPAMSEILYWKLRHAVQCQRAANGAWESRPESQIGPRRDAADDLFARQQKIAAEHQGAFRDIALRIAASGASAYRELSNDVYYSLSPPAAPGVLANPTVESMFVLRADYNATHEGNVHRWGQALRPLAERLYNAARRNISERAGLRTLADRFRIRCQHFDLRELRARTGSTRKKELTLTAQFARYIYDAGHFPFSELNLGNARADVVSLGANVYVEAKQVSMSSKPYIIRGYQELLDGMHQLPSEHGIHTALLMVFVLGGPLYDIEEMVSPGLLTIPIVVDLREANRKGSRAAQAKVPITRADFEAAVRRR